MPDVPADILAILEGPLSEMVTFIDADDLTDAEAAVVPGWWLEATQLPPSDGVARALDEWQRVVPNALPHFTTWLRTNGIGVFLGRSEDQPLLAYGARTVAGAFCWHGFAPNADPRNPTLDLSGLPDMLRHFVSELHDGFRLLSLFNNSFLAVDEWSALGDVVEPEELELTGDRLMPDVDHLVPFFYDFGSSSLCVELQQDTTDTQAGWVAYDDQLEAVDDIWTVIDRWLLSLVAP